MVSAFIRFYNCLCKLHEACRLFTLSFILWSPQIKGFSWALGSFLPFYLVSSFISIYVRHLFMVSNKNKHKLNWLNQKWNSSAYRTKEAYGRTNLSHRSIGDSGSSNLRLSFLLSLVFFKREKFLSCRLPCKHHLAEILPVYGHRYNHWIFYHLYKISCSLIGLWIQHLSQSP